MENGLYLIGWHDANTSPGWAERIDESALATVYTAGFTHFGKHITHIAADFNLCGTVGDVIAVPTQNIIARHRIASPSEFAHLVGERGAWRVMVVSRQEYLSIMEGRRNAKRSRCR